MDPCDRGLARSGCPAAEGETAGGAYVATPVVAMYAPMVARAAGNNKGPPQASGGLAPPPTPKRAYMPTTTVGTYAPPAKGARI